MSNTSPTAIKSIDESRIPGILVLPFADLPQFPETVRTEPATHGRGEIEKATVVRVSRTVTRALRLFDS
jgi:hypothetical protein